MNRDWLRSQLLWQLPQLVFVLSGLVGFLRDYFLVGSHATVFIYTVFLIEAVSDIVTRSVCLRTLNLGPTRNVYFRLPVFLAVGGFFVAAGALATLAFVVAALPLISGILVFAIPANALYTYAANFVLVQRRFTAFYSMALLKSALIAAGFLLASESFILSSYGAMLAISLALYAGAVGKYRLATPFAGAPRLLRVIARRAVRDVSVHVHSALHAAVFLVDKQFLALAGTDVLFYIYISKFINFAVSLNTVLIQRWQIETREQRRARTLLRIVLRTAPFFLAALGGYCLMFLVVFPELPAARLTPFSNAVFAAGIGLMAMQMLRDAGSRWFYINDRYRVVGYVVGTTLAAYVAGVAIVRRFVPVELVVSLTVLHLVAFCAYLVIRSRRR